MIRDARKIAEEENMRFDDVLYLFEIESRQMASALIEKMYDDLAAIKALLEKINQFDDREPRVRML